MHVLVAAGVGALSASSFAQTGVLDQSSPFTNAEFFGGVWQQQIRAGRTGVLEGVTLVTSAGSPGAYAAVRIRRGAAWAGSPALFDGVVTRTVATGDETHFVDMTNANAMFEGGEVFVLEYERILAGFPGMRIRGNYVEPPGTPMYPEPLFNASGPFNNGGWRLGFETYVVVASCYPDCTADGALTVADFGCFQTKFVAGDPYADCNGDGVRTVADFACFQTRFVAGCP